MPEGLKWTQRRPTKVGTYWYKDQYRGVGSVEVTEWNIGGGPFLLAEFAGGGRFELKYLHGYWFGPVSPPEHKAGK